MIPLRAPLAVPRHCGWLGLLLLALVVDPVVADDDRTLRQVAAFNPVPLDPIYQRLDDENLLQLHLFEGLTTTELENKIVPGQANYWDVSADGKTYTFFLRHGLRWSDGSPLTAAQFVAQFHRLFDKTVKAYPKPEAAYRMIRNAAAIQAGKLPVTALGVTALDEQTLEIRLEAADPDFLRRLQQPVLAPLPTQLYARHGGGWAQAGYLLSNGPYRLAGHIAADGTVRLEKNPYYYNAVNLHYAHVELRPLTDPEQAVADLLAGRVDLLRQVPAEGLARITDHRQPVFNRVESRVSTAYLAVNTQDQLLQQAPVRQALALLPDRQVFAAALPGAVEPAFALTPSNPTLGWRSLRPDWATWPAEQRMAAAKQLLAGVDAAQGVALEILVAEQLEPAVRKALQEALLLPWQASGMAIKLTVLPVAQLQQRLAAGEYQLAYQQWHSTKGEDPAPFQELLANRVDYAAELRELQDPELNQHKLFAVYQQLEQRLGDELPLIPLYFQREYAALSPKLMYSDETHLQSLLPAVIAPAF